ncbi:MAG: Mth938-like domain-containing protein [Gammaproteobacteria bacterium]
MKLSLELNDGNAYAVQAYELGVIQINNSRHTETLVVMPDSLHTDYRVLADPDDLTESHFSELSELGAELIVIGTGSNQRFLHPRLWAHLSRQGIGVEFMDTAAACRTYNILMSEGRRVAALLFPIGE